LCRTYFDLSDDYSLADHAPWLSFFIGEKKESPKDDTLLTNSLKLAIQLAKTDYFEKYKSGFSAYEYWTHALRNYSVSYGKKGFEHHEVNFTLFNNLLDARKAAVGYLTSIRVSEKLLEGIQILKGYQTLVDLLDETQQNLLPSFASGQESWNAELLTKQAQVLEQAAALEKEIISRLEKGIV
jgi:hypothetical protein